MAAKREPLIKTNPLAESTPEPRASLVAENITAEPTRRRQFTYRLPFNIGLKFKLYCASIGRTSEDVMAELLQDYLKDKRIEI